MTKVASDPPGIGTHFCFLFVYFFNYDLHPCKLVYFILLWTSWLQSSVDQSILRTEAIPDPFCYPMVPGTTCRFIVTWWVIKACGMKADFPPKYRRSSKLMRLTPLNLSILNSCFSIKPRVIFHRHSNSRWEEINNVERARQKSPSERRICNWFFSTCWKHESTPKCFGILTAGSFPSGTQGNGTFLLQSVCKGGLVPFPLHSVDLRLYWIQLRSN